MNVNRSHKVETFMKNVAESLNPQACSNNLENCNQSNNTRGGCTLYDNLKSVVNEVDAGKENLMAWQQTQTCSNLSGIVDYNDNTEWRSTNERLPSSLQLLISSRDCDNNLNYELIAQETSLNTRQQMPRVTNSYDEAATRAALTEGQPKSQSNLEKTMKVPPSPRLDKYRVTESHRLDRCYMTDSPGLDRCHVKQLQNKYRFSTAMWRHNQVAVTAIQSLDCLNDQIVQCLVSSQSPATTGDLLPENESVHSSMNLIRKLLMDAQSRFRKMVDDNKNLATHIDTSIQAANQEVSMLKAELASTNKRLNQISMREEAEKVDKATQVDRIDRVDRVDRGFTSASRKVEDKEKRELEAKVQELTRANEQLEEDKKCLLATHDKLKCTYEAMKTNDNLRAENSTLESQLKSLRSELALIQTVRVEGVGSHGMEGVGSHGKPSYGEMKLELIQTQQELSRAKEVLQSMKSDRKKLKSEKLDLLGQMKKLYITLEEKETELRDFIHNYEQRVKESDKTIQQFSREKEEMEREKWEFITKAKDAVERAMVFKAELDLRDERVRELEARLSQATEQVERKVDDLLPSTPATTSDSDLRHDDDEVFPSVDTGFSTMEESSVLNCTFSQELENTNSSPVSNTDSALTSDSLFKWFTNSSDFELPLETKPKKKRTLGSLTRVFSRSRLRRSLALPHAESLMTEDCGPKLRVLSQENYQEKLNTIEKMVGVHMREWRAHQVLAWLEITLAMPMYAQSCLSNVKSGKVLLGLSDNELSAALGVTNPMHRRKIKLAIEQHRNPHDIKHLKASEMDPTWIAHRFLVDIGLPQYTNIFEEQLCDGHVLNTLTRRDLEKYFSVHRKFHQSSILHAIELLRRIDFNKEKLYHRHNLSEDKDSDLIVWTNERVIKWIRCIDLGEYSENLVESGVHGALMVLDPSFTADTLASILGIPPSKSYIKRHLASELDSILKPARVALETESKEKYGDKNKRRSSQDKGHQGYEEKGRRKSQEEGRSRLSFRGSIGRAFGKKIREDVNMNSHTSKKMISAPVAMQHSSLSSLDSQSELIKKGFCLKNAQLDNKCASMEGHTANGFIVENIRQKCLARSDQTLHRSFDLHVIHEKNIDNVFYGASSNPVVFNDDRRPGTRASVNDMGQDNRSSFTDMGLGNTALFNNDTRHGNTASFNDDMRHDNRGLFTRQENFKDSAAASSSSSQETLTEQPDSRKQTLTEQLDSRKHKIENIHNKTYSGSVTPVDVHVRNQNSNGGLNLQGQNSQVFTECSLWPAIVQMQQNTSYENHMTDASSRLNTSSYENQMTNTSDRHNRLITRENSRYSSESNVTECMSGLFPQTTSV